MNKVNMIHIPESWGVTRTPPTPPEERKEVYSLGKTYEEVFDWTTLFADAIQIGEGRVLLVGPPLYDLKEIIKFSDGKTELTHSFHDLKKVTLTLVETESDTIYLKHPAEDVEIKVSEVSTKFSGLKCASAMQRDESIVWIKDWISYHHIEHGIEGFIIYDNNSSIYTPEELQAELDKLEYDIVVEVIDFQMPWGPRTKKWDSDYVCEVRYEHMKYKYGWCCDCILNHDIDEFFVTSGNKFDDILNTLKAKGILSLIHI